MSSTLKIVILDRGFVLVGNVRIDGDGDGDGDG